MQSKSPRNFRKVLFSSFKKITLIVVFTPIFLVVSIYVFYMFLNAYQALLLKENLSKIKVGMTSTEVEAMLGWPHKRTISVEDKSIRLSKSQFLSKFRDNSYFASQRIDYKGTPISAQGREIWIYDNPDYGGVNSPSNDPVIVFDLKTKKVVQITRTYYEGSP